MGGRTSIAEMRAGNVLKTIPVVILTTSDSDEDIVRSYRLGANCMAQIWSRKCCSQLFIRWLNQNNQYL